MEATSNTTKITANADENTEVILTPVKKLEKDVIVASKAKKILYYSLVVDFESIINIVKKNIIGIKYGSVVDGKIVCDDTVEHGSVAKAVAEAETKEPVINTKDDAIDALVEDVANIKIDDKFAKLIGKKKLENGDNVVINNEDKVYKLVTEPHVTLLFTNGKPHENEHELVPFIIKKQDNLFEPTAPPDTKGDSNDAKEFFCGTTEDSSDSSNSTGEIDVTINRIGYSGDFIVLGVDIPSHIPYYGNDIKHITVGLRQREGKHRVFAKDSPNAFSDNTITFDSPITIKGNIIAVTQN